MTALILATNEIRINLKIWFVDHTCVPRVRFALSLLIGYIEKSIVRNIELFLSLVEFRLVILIAGELMNVRQVQMRVVVEPCLLRRGLLIIAHLKGVRSEFLINGQPSFFHEVRHLWLLVISCVGIDVLHFLKLRIDDDFHVQLLILLQHFVRLVGNLVNADCTD